MTLPATRRKGLYKDEMEAHPLYEAARKAKACPSSILIRTESYPATNEEREFETY